MRSIRPLALTIAVLLAVSLLQATAWAADGDTIHAAARRGDLPRVQALLDGAPGLINARTTDGETPLQYAILGRQPAVVEFLLARGADANASDVHGSTALHMAAAARDAKLIGTLLSYGAVVEVANQLGDTPLHIAAARAHQAALRALLIAGADVNARNTRGQTPRDVLGAAVRLRDAEVEGLIDALADLLVESWATSQTPAVGEPPPTVADERDDGVGPLTADYRSYAEIAQILQDAASDYPDICQVHDLGLSYQGRHLWALNISDNVGAEEDEPEFKYVSTMHGNETVGNEMCLFFIDLLLTSYGVDPDLTSLVDEIDIWIVPLMNPDGYEAGTRENAQGVDLNRDFPEGTNGDPNTTAGRAPETAVIMNWTFASSFTLSANMHTGALVANYPYDNDGMGSVFSPTPDEDLFVYISEQYSQHNPPMWNSPYFTHGITNGAEWYAVDGGMQDWHYRYMGGNEVTLELSNTFSPPYSQIPQYWNENRDSMLAYMETCLIGVRGLVTDAVTGEPVFATVTVTGRDHEVYSDPDVGDYHRLLLPGTYELSFEADGYETLSVSNVTVNGGDATRLDVQMARTVVTYPNGGETLYVDVPTTVTWDGNPTAQFHVQGTDNFGDVSAVTDDFERTSLGPDYATGGAADWYITTDSAHGGTRSARSGVIGNNATSWMTRNVGGGTVSFWYRVSSEDTYDFLNFYIDDERQLHLSGEIGWTYYTTTLPDGPHELKWEYTKDYSWTGGSDRTWIDDLEIADDNTVWTDIIALTDPGALATPWTPTTVSSDCKVRVRAYYGGGSYGGWDESDATFEVVEGLPGDLNCDSLINGFDIDPFVLVLGDTPPDYPAYYSQYPDCDHMRADCNGDGDINGFDIEAFLELLD
ncbi:MAG: ankyrin repeat domain-containing protein [Planctomycetes bacterium]|nr:ankyrin repeat domain-containing protein [Planctomycetota bacterium]